MAAILGLLHATPALAQQAQTIAAESSLSPSTTEGASVLLLNSATSATGYVYGGDGAAYLGSAIPSYGGDEFIDANLWSCSIPGTYTVTVQAPDGTVDGVEYAASNILSFNITVQAPGAQTITTISPATQSAFTNSTVFFWVDGSSTGYTWSSGTVPWGSSGVYETWSAPGTYTVTVQAPAQGATWAASNVLTFTVNVLPPQTQTITSDTALTQSAFAGAGVYLAASGSNSGYSWSAVGGSPATSNASAVVFYWATPGTYTVTCQAPAQDPTWAASNVITYTVTILPPAPQTITSTTALTQSALVGAGVYLAASGSSSGYTWSAVGGSPASSNASAVVFCWATPGTYTVTCQAPAQDPMWAASNVITYTVTVAAQAQTVTLSPFAGTVVVNAQQTFTASGSSTGYVWSNGATPNAPGTVATVSWPTPGRYFVSVYAPAGGIYAASPLASALFTVIPAPPANSSQTTNTGTPGGPDQATMLGKPMPAIGGSVQLATGAEAFSRHLFSFTGARNWNLDVSYNSALASSQAQAGMLGFGWSHPYEANVAVSGANLVVNWDSTHNNTFEPVSGAPGTFTSAEVAAQYDVLTANSGGGWTLTRPDQSQLVFAANGSLSEDHDPHGRKLVLAYNGAGRLSTITEPVSATQLTFAYTAAGLLSGLTDSTGASVAFTYNTSSMLTTITNQNANKVTFAYDANHNILTLTGNDGTILTTNTYDSLGRVVTQIDGVTGHGPLTFSYQQQSISSNIVTTATDKTGAVSTYTFDPDFNLLAVVDPLGRTTSATYDTSDNLTSKTDALGNVATFTYDGSGNLLTSTDAAGKVTAFTYDAQNRLLTTTDAIGGVTTRTYDSSSNLLTLTDPAGHTTTWTYDANSLPLTQTLPGGGVNSFACTNGHLTQLTDPNGVVTHWTYDADGRVVTSKDADGNTTSFAYDGAGNLLTATNPLGQVTSSTYDPRNRMLTKTAADGAVTTYAYDNNNNLVTVTDALGNVTTRAYDANDRLLSVTDPLGHKVACAYDSDGETVSTTDATGSVATFNYDADGHRTAAIDPLGNHSASTYDARGRLTQITDPLSRSTTFAYDDLGRRITSTDSLGLLTASTYDPVGHLTGVSDPGSLITSQTFDANGARASFSDPRDNATTLTNDLGGRVAAVTTAGSRVTAFTFNDRGLPLTTTLPSGHATTTTYDTAGRVATIADGVGTDTITRDADGRQLTVVENGQTLARVYDALGRVTKYTDAAGNVIGYGYDAAGNLATLTYPDGKVVTYTYDAANRFKTVTDWASRVISYTYDLDGRLTATTRPNGTSQTRTYDAAGQLSSLTELAADGVTVIASTNPTYDADGRITGETLTPGVPVPSAASTTAMTYDADNRLLSVNGQATTFDADGNLLSLPGGNPAAYTYDARNRLTAAGGVSYSYDPEGHRVGVTGSTGTTTYVVNPNSTLTQTLMATGPDGTVTHYVYGLGLAYQEATPTGGSPAAQFYHYDRRGNTVAISDAAGTVTDTATYGIYGKLLTRTGTTPTPFLFNGLYGVMTDANGLTYHRARYYNPSLRRFINQDVTVGDIGSAASLNRYAYANGNPVSLVDPFGMMAWDPSANGWGTTPAGAADVANSLADFAGHAAFGTAQALQATGEFPLNGDIYSMGFNGNQWAGYAAEDVAAAKAAQAAAATAGRVVTAGTAVAGVGLSVYEVYQGRASDESLARGGVTAATTAVAFIPEVGPFIAAVLSISNAAGAFDSNYSSFNNNPRFHKQHGGAGGTW
jgi:RHS repeat-associated protein